MDSAHQGRAARSIWEVVAGWREIYFRNLRTGRQARGKFARQWRHPGKGLRVGAPFYPRVTVA